MFWHDSASEYLVGHSRHFHSIARGAQSIGVELPTCVMLIFLSMRFREVGATTGVRETSAKTQTAHTRPRAPASDAIAPIRGRARALECYLFPLEYNRAIGPRADCNRLQSLRARGALAGDCSTRFRMHPCQGSFAPGRLSSNGWGTLL